MTGSNVHDHPLRAVVADRRKDSTTSSRLMMRRLLLAASLLAALRVSSLESLVADPSPASSSLMASAPMPATEVVVVLFAHVAVLSFGQDLLLHQRRVARIDDDIVCKVQNLLQYARADIQDQAHARRDALEVPDVRYTGAASSMWPMRSRRTLALA